jgi:hypothetical protein
MNSKSVFAGVVIFLIALIGIYSYQKNQKEKADIEKNSAEVLDTYKEMQNTLYDSIIEKEFVNYAKDTIQKRCPFYEPDGVTYRQCLADWEQELADAVIPELTDEVHAYCSTFTAQYADETSLEGMELFLKCSIYKLSS